MDDQNEGKDIWADGAEGFFAEFSAATASSSSRRKLNRLANSDDRATDMHGNFMQNGKSSECEIERTARMAASRQRLATLVASRASPRELQRVAAEVSSQRRQQLNRNPPDRSSSTQDRCDRDNLSLSWAGRESARNGEDVKHASFGRKKKAKLAEKLKRKSERADEARDKSRCARQQERRRRS